MLISRYKSLFECQTDSKETSYRGLSAVSRPFSNTHWIPRINRGMTESRKKSSLLSQQFVVDTQIPEQITLKPKLFRTVW